MRRYDTPYEQKIYGGMHDSDQSLISRYEGVLVQNGIIRVPGVFRGRPGLTLLGDDTGSQRIQGYGIKRNGTSFITRVVNGAVNATIEELSGGSWGAIGGATRTLDIDIFPSEFSNGAVYYPEQTLACGKYDGTTWSTVAAIPAGKWFIEWKNFGWVAGNATFPKRLYFSNIGAPETWTGSDYIDFPEDITGIKAYFNRLVVTMKHGVAYLEGSGQSDFIVAGKTIYTPTAFDFGISSHESLQIVGNELWGMDEEGNIRRIFRSDNDAVFGDIVSEKVQGVIDTLNKSQLAKVTAAVVDGYYILYAPTGAGTENDVGLYYDFKATLPRGVSRWIKHTGWTPSHFALADISGVPTLVIGENSADSKSYTWAGTSDNSTAIEMIWRSKQNDMKYPNWPKLFRWGRQEYDAIGDYNGSVKANLDERGNNTIKTASFLGNNKTLGVDWVLGTHKLGADGRLTSQFNFKDGGDDIAARHVQMELNASYDSAIPEWYNQIIMYKLLKMR